MVGTGEFPVAESGTNRGRRLFTAARSVRPQRNDVGHARYQTVRTRTERVSAAGGGARRQSADLAAPADPADTTIAGLHAVLQIAFGWNGDHLHRFVVHGREYGIAYSGGPSFGDDPRRVRLGDLGLRPTERFTYHYDFTAGWCHDLRVEQIRIDLAAQNGQHCPVCTGGRRAGPPQDCGGVQAFLENTQPHHVLSATIRAAEILGMLLDEDVPRFGEHRDELAGLLPLLGVDRFDRRRLNRALAGLAATGTRAA